MWQTSEWIVVCIGSGHTNVSLATVPKVSLLSPVLPRPHVPQATAHVVSTHTLSHCK